jgi:hypothetical protein
LRYKDTNKVEALIAMFTKHAERIMVTCLGNPFKFVLQGMTCLNGSSNPV